MTKIITDKTIADIAGGYSDNPHDTFSLKADAYTSKDWFDADLKQIMTKSWQWVCHVEKLRKQGAYTTIEIAGSPIAIVRGKDDKLRAFYNVCKHRAHALLSGDGRTSVITCPYHAWAYRLDGQLVKAPHAEHLENFNTDEICLDEVQVEEFCGFIFVNLDPNASSLASQILRTLPLVIV